MRTVAMKGEEGTRGSGETRGVLERETHLLDLHHHHPRLNHRERLPDPQVHPVHVQREEVNLPPEALVFDELRQLRE